MNEDRLKGDWTRLKGRIREKWGELTDDDLDIIQGRREQLAGLLQKRYGLAKEAIEEEIREFEEQSRDPGRRDAIV